MGGRLFDRVEEALGARVLEAARLTGGDIHEAFRVTLEDGTAVFVKGSAGAPEGMFEAEAAGLDLLAGRSDVGGIGRRGERSHEAGLRVPEVLAVGREFLALEYIEPARGAGDAAYRELGAALAGLHRDRTGGAFGLNRDNWIGSLPQSNRRHATWGAFFVAERVRPQVERGVRKGLFEAAWTRRVEGAVARMEAVFPEEPPTLVHGDLWGGNVLVDHEGRGVLIDPAAHYGHREMDLAMTRLFGGFPEAFYEGYEQVHPLAPGHRERNGLCQLYPLLVHANLFGGGYVGRCRELLGRWFG